MEVFREIPGEGFPCSIEKVWEEAICFLLLAVVGSTREPRTAAAILVQSEKRPPGEQTEDVGGEDAEHLALITLLAESWKHPFLDLPL